MNYNCLTFKKASEAWEFDQIHKLNYRTFVEEIPQHPPNPEKRLIDKFHDENTYFICLDGTRLGGMLAMRGKRPFSLDEKVADLDAHLPTDASVCEFRLLAVEPDYRQTNTFAQLLHFAAGHGIKEGYNLAVASGTLRQKRLYSRMGFVPFADQVGTEEAKYQPMYLTLNSALQMFERIGAPLPVPVRKVSFMPGPVEVNPKVREAFNAPAISHRSEEFLSIVSDTKKLLCELTGSVNVELLLGSGTLANDVVAGQLRLLESPGLLLSNGEFGERLIDHAFRQGLSFEIMRSPWGSPYDIKALEALISERKDINWLWSTHCETSTGLLNDIDMLKDICLRHSVLLCMDCTSSLGTLLVDLNGVYLASSVSGKGLASFPGISMAFYNHEVVSNRSLPRYLDLGYYREQKGVPFTHSSNLTAALNASLARTDFRARFDSIRCQYSWMRTKLEETGLKIVVPEEHSSPSVLSIALKPDISTISLGEYMESRGYMLSYRSSYLIEKNIIQICLMGETSQNDCLNMLNELMTHIGAMQSNLSSTILTSA